MWLVGLDIFDTSGASAPAGASAVIVQAISTLRAPSPAISEARAAMSDPRRRPPCPPRPHPPRQPGRQASEDLRRRGDAGREEGRPSRQHASAAAAAPQGRSTFGRGRRAALSLSSRSPGRRVVIMTRIVRHQGTKFRSAPLSKHVAYLKREGVTRDGADARMFDARVGRRRRPRPSPSGARTTGIISGSPSRPRTRPRWPIFAPSPAS